MGSEEGNNRQTVNSGGFEAEFKELVSIGRHAHSIEITRCSLGTLLASEGWNSDGRVSLAGSNSWRLCPLASEIIEGQLYAYSDERVCHHRRKISG